MEPLGFLTPKPKNPKLSQKTLKLLNPKPLNPKLSPKP